MGASVGDSGDGDEGIKEVVVGLGASVAKLLEDREAAERDLRLAEQHAEEHAAALASLECQVKELEASAEAHRAASEASGAAQAEALGRELTLREQVGTLTAAVASGEAAVAEAKERLAAASKAKAELRAEHAMALASLQAHTSELEVTI